MDHGIQSHHSMGNRREKWKQCQTLFFGAPKSLQMVTAAMKLKDTYSLEGMMLKLKLQSFGHLMRRVEFKSINSSVLSFLYSLTLTSIHDHRKNHSLD